jgi:hypothetical protein
MVLALEGDSTMTSCLPEGTLAFGVFAPLALDLVDFFFFSVEGALVESAGGVAGVSGEGVA